MPIGLVPEAPNVNAVVLAGPYRITPLSFDTKFRVPVATTPEALSVEADVT